MSDHPAGRFTAPTQNMTQRLSTNTIGLVHLSDFRKRRAEVLEQQEREVREAATSGVSSSAVTSRVATPGPPNIRENSEAEKGDDAANAHGPAIKKIRRKKVLLSFQQEDDDGDDEGSAAMEDTKVFGKIQRRADPVDYGESGERKAKSKLSANLAVGLVPRALTKAALRREAAEREALRKEFLVLQAIVKATEIAIPFVFYDGTNVPGGIVRVKKADHTWVFLDKSRKVGAAMGVGGRRTANKRHWARVSVDDLLMVRGSIIVPHHYDFYFFIMNKTLGPGRQLLFDFSSEVSSKQDARPVEGLSNPSKSGKDGLSSLRNLEGFADDPAFTKVVDRRWYQRNKHIYPASTWQEFDPEKDYQNEIRRDLGGNAFFYSK